MSTFRRAAPGDVDAIVAMMRGYYEQDGYTFVEAEARAAALITKWLTARALYPRP